MRFFGKKHAADSGAVTEPKNDTHNDSMPNDLAPAKQISDPEKELAGYANESHTALPQMHSPRVTIDPELEARVVRKLDLRVPTLLGFLCKASYYGGSTFSFMNPSNPYVSFRSSCSPRPK